MTFKTTNTPQEARPLCINNHQYQAQQQATPQALYSHYDSNVAAYHSLPATVPACSRDEFNAHHLEQPVSSSVADYSNNRPDVPVNYKTETAIYNQPMEYSNFNSYNEQIQVATVVNGHNYYVDEHSQFPGIYLTQNHPIDYNYHSQPYGQQHRKANSSSTSSSSSSLSSASWPQGSDGCPCSYSYYEINHFNESHNHQTEQMQDRVSYYHCSADNGYRHNQEAQYEPEGHHQIRHPSADESISSSSNGSSQERGQNQPQLIEMSCTMSNQTTEDVGYYNSESSSNNKTSNKSDSSQVIELTNQQGLFNNKRGELSKVEFNKELNRQQPNGNGRLVVEQSMSECPRFANQSSSVLFPDPDSAGTQGRQNEVNNSLKLRSGKQTVKKPIQQSNNSVIQRMNHCGVCGRNYARPSTLKTHLRTHTNERPFKCSVCFKTFSQAANLTAHQRVHTGE